jgi:hypothetical protein
LVGDPARLHEWFPISGCRVEGDKRWVDLPSGITFEEDIVLVDPVMRRFQYRIVNNPLTREHLGTVDVIPDGHGHCIVVYSTEMKPDVLALVTGGAATTGLANAKRICESDGESDDKERT